MVLFASSMNKGRLILYCALLILVLIAWIYAEEKDSNKESPERVKIALREVGNQLLLQQNDSTSRVLPVVAKEDSVYELSFETGLTFAPGALVAVVDSIFQKTTLPDNYIAEVIQCTDEEVAYSYEMTDTRENTLVACKSRVLPKACYTIALSFTGGGKTSFINPKVFRLLFALIAFIFLVDVLLTRRKRTNLAKENLGTFTIGMFKFYPEQNKLVKEAAEINLSKKECELLAIFVASPNTVIKRDELTKRVWEDNGVIVGRSLDTYISKLRKKLQDDDTIKLTNVHGVGYKLELG